MKKEDVKFDVYLAGYAKDLEYRKFVKENYGDLVNCIDPMTMTVQDVNDNIGQDLSDFFIVRRDKMLIDKCHILTAKIEYPTEENTMIVGTIMEIMYAHTRGIPVFLISSEDSVHENPWFKAHTAIHFYNVKECFDFITQYKTLGEYND